MKEQIERLKANASRMVYGTVLDSQKDATPYRIVSVYLTMLEGYHMALNELRKSNGIEPEPFDFKKYDNVAEIYRWKALDMQPPKVEVGEIVKAGWMADEYSTTFNYGDRLKVMEVNEADGTGRFRRQDDGKEGFLFLNEIDRNWLAIFEKNQ